MGAAAPQEAGPGRTVSTYHLYGADPHYRSNQTVGSESRSGGMRQVWHVAVCLNDFLFRVIKSVCDFKAAWRLPGQPTSLAWRRRWESSDGRGGMNHVRRKICGGFGGADCGKDHSSNPGG